MSPWPSVGIIILNWNGRGDTLACIESLSRLDYPACRTAMVDNGSTDGSVAAVATRFPEVTLIENGRNLGYAGGNNVGLRWAMAEGLDYALLLNNDTEVAPDLLRRLVTAAEADTNCGAVGPTIYYWASPERIWSAGGQVNWRNGSTRMMHLNEADTGQLGPSPWRADFVTGCALLIKRTALERVGLLDERFFAYYEETEWCARAGREGLSILQVPEAHLWHKIPLDAPRQFAEGALLYDPQSPVVCPPDRARPRHSPGDRDRRVRAHLAIVVPAAPLARRQGCPPASHGTRRLGCLSRPLG